MWIIAPCQTVWTSTSYWHWALANKSDVIALKCALHRTIVIVVGPSLLATIVPPRHNVDIECLSLRHSCFLQVGARTSPSVLDSVSTLCLSLLLPFSRLCSVCLCFFSACCCSKGMWSLTHCCCHYHMLALHAKQRELSFDCRTAS